MDDGVGRTRRGGWIAQNRPVLVLVIALLVLLLLGCSVLSCCLFQWLLGPPTGGELTARSVSPNGRWEVRLYYLDPGAAATAGERAEVVDLTGKRPTRNIYFEVGADRIKEIRWKGENTVVLNGREIDVRTASYRPDIW